MTSWCWTYGGHTKKKGKVVNSASSRTHQLPPCRPFVIIKQKNVWRKKQERPWGLTQKIKIKI